MIRFIALLFLFVGNISILHAEEFLLWKSGMDVPVRVPFVAGSDKDKKISFDESIAFGVTPTFKKHYRVQVIESVVYVRSIVPTDKKYRVLAKGSKSGNIYIMLFENSSDESDFESLVIKSTPAGKSVGASRIDNPFSSAVTPVQLARYASQNLYAPRHAIEPLKGVRRTQLGMNDDMDWIYQGSELSIKPLVAYSVGEWTVTAFEVTNKNPFEKIYIDPRKIFERVDADSAFTQHQWVGVTEDNNKSALYVITKGAFVNALKVRGW